MGKLAHILRLWRRWLVFHQPVLVEFDDFTWFLPQMVFSGLDLQCDLYPQMRPPESLALFVYLTLKSTRTDGITMHTWLCSITWLKRVFRGELFSLDEVDVYVDVCPLEGFGIISFYSKKEKLNGQMVLILISGSCDIVLP